MKPKTFYLKLQNLILVLFSPDIPQFPKTFLVVLYSSFKIAVFASDFKFCRTTPAFAFAFAFSVKFQKLIFHLLVVSSYFLFTKKMYKWGMHAELRPGITTVYYIVHMYILYSVSLYIRHHGTYTRKTEISRQFQ